MSPWSDFYESRLTYAYLNNFKNKYALFLSILEAQIRKSNFVAEEHGCGIGTVTKLLKSGWHRGHFVLIDNDRDVLHMATTNVTRERVVFALKDIREEMPFMADVIYSHGVLEHFPDTDICRIIQNQKMRASTIIHCVPSNEYKTPSFGDERLMPPMSWQRICNPDSIMSFNGGKDLILNWGLK